MLIHWNTMAACGRKGNKLAGLQNMVATGRMQIPRMGPRGAVGVDKRTATSHRDSLTGQSVKPVSRTRTRLPCRFPLDEGPWIVGHTETDKIVSSGLRELFLLLVSD